jgi:hypothetical protein
MRRIFGGALDTHARRGALVGVLSLSCVVALTLGTPRFAKSQPSTLPLAYSHTGADLVTKVEGMVTELDRRSYLRSSVCPPNRPYYKPSGYKRYLRHRFRPFRDYYPFDPPFRCASWPWSTHVCVGAYVAPHPLPVGIDCVR